MFNIIKLNEKDNIGIAPMDIPKNADLNIGIRSKTKVPYGHKIYDNGDIGVKDGILIKNDFIEDFDFEDKFMGNEYLGGEKYYKYHILNIFKK